MQNLCLCCCGIIAHLEERSGPKKRNYTPAGNSPLVGDGGGGRHSIFLKSAKIHMLKKIGRSQGPVVGGQTARKGRKGGGLLGGKWEKFFGGHTL